MGQKLEPICYYYITSLATLFEYSPACLIYPAIIASDLCPVWVLICQEAAPATAADVTNPARKLCPE